MPAERSIKKVEQNVGTDHPREGVGDVDWGGMANHPPGPSGIEIDRRPVATPLGILRRRSQAVEVVGVYGGEVVVERPRAQRPHEISTARKGVDHEKVASAGKIVAPAQMGTGKVRNSHRLEQVERGVYLKRAIRTLDHEISVPMQIADQTLSRCPSQAVKEHSPAVLAVDVPALRSQQSAQRRGRRREAASQMVLGQLTQLLHVIVGGLNKRFERDPQVAEVARDQIEPGGTFGGELGGGETAGQQHQQQRDGGDAQSIPQGQRPCWDASKSAQRSVSGGSGPGTNT